MGELAAMSKAEFEVECMRVKVAKENEEREKEKGEQEKEKADDSWMQGESQEDQPSEHPPTMANSFPPSKPQLPSSLPDKSVPTSAPPPTPSSIHPSFVPTVEGGPDRNPEGLQIVINRPVHLNTSMSSSTRKRQAPTAGPRDVKWFIDRRNALLQGMEAVEGWGALLQSWFAWEEHNGYTKKGVAIPKVSQRPSAVEIWAKYARNDTIPKGVTDGLKLGEGLRSWWRAINPGWRIEAASGMFEQSGSGDWDALAAHGPNGLINILACLRWWYLLAGDSLDLSVWGELMADVSWVLSMQLHEVGHSLAPPLKKQRTEESS